MDPGSGLVLCIQPRSRIAQLSTLLGASQSKDIGYLQPSGLPLIDAVDCAMACGDGGDAVFFRGDDDQA